jgi:hypothetical protein
VKQNVSINGNSTIDNMTSGFHKITIYANDSFGNMGASETIIFTVEVPFPTIPVAAASGVTAAVVIAGGLVLYRRNKSMKVKDS